MGTTDRRDAGSPRADSSAAPQKAPWSAPRIVDHGSIRHLVRGGSGGFPDPGAGRMIQPK
jgi:hypothetical protein